MFRIPFSWLPGHWGLKGKTRERARAEYELDGYDLEKKLLEIDSTDLDTDLRKLDLKHGKITQFEHDLDQAGDDVIAQLDAKLKHKVISEREHKRQVADHNEEPYVEVIEMNMENTSQGYVDLDWNDHFIQMLHENGFKGTNDEDMVNKWFNQLCRTILVQEMQDQDFGLENPDSDVVYRKDLEDDKDNTENKQKGNNSTKDIPKQT